MLTKTLLSASKSSNRNTRKIRYWLEKYLEIESILSTDKEEFRFKYPKGFPCRISSMAELHKLFPAAAGSGGPPRPGVAPVTPARNTARNPEEVVE